tara:strand:+ start:983 stop:3247 length:2265 start_codon:yes stop_codon:yes gene_type:complete
MAMTVEQAYQILSKFHGYTGPRTKRAISQFVNARDLPVAVKNRGGLIGMQEGGDTEKKEKPSGETVETEQPKGDKKDDVGTNPPPPDYTPEDVQKGQQQLIGGAFTDPSTVVDKPTVKTIDPDTTGTEIADTKGQVSDEDTPKIKDDDIESPTAKTADTPTDVTAQTYTADKSADKMKELTEGKIKQKQKVDAEGNPMVDAEGNPIMEDVIDPETGEPVREGGFEAEQIDKDTITKVEGQKKERVKKDAEGNVVYQLDAEGNRLLDADGNPIPQMETYTDIEDKKAATLSEEEIEKLKATAATRTLQDGSKVKQTPQLDADGNPVLDAEGNPIMVDMLDAQGNPVMEESELISGSAVDQAKIKEEMDKAEAASMRDELKDILGEFDDGKTPTWAAGAMRKANQVLAARGLSASSMAGQAVIQAMMESALPIAQIDTSNKQQMAVLKAEQRAKFLQQEFDQNFETKVRNAAKISEIANMNFTAEQQVILENSRFAQTAALQNLTNEQAVVMAEIAQIASLETQGLSNMQQAQVENAKNLLQVDISNLEAAQQTELLKSTQQANALLTDVASENAAKQFNAASQNQINEFNKSIQTQVKQFNAAQQNSMAQFSAGQENSIAQFNASMENQRDMFNAQNSLVIAQANAKWRQDTSTINTAAENQANFEFAKMTNGLSMQALDQIWQRERDLMQFAVAQSESALDRATKLLLGDKNLEGIRKQIEATEGAAKSNFFARLLFGNSGIFGDKGLFGLGDD